MTVTKDKKEKYKAHNNYLRCAYWQKEKKAIGEYPMKYYRLIRNSGLVFLPCVAASVFLLATQVEAAIKCIAPPALSNPVTYTNKCPEDSGGPLAVSARDRDVYIQLPNYRICRESITVNYARNIRIMGGHFVYNGSKSGVINIGMTSGTTFIDGLHIDVNQKYADGIRVYRHTGRLIVQNTRVEGISGTVKGIHGDVTHAQGGGPLRFLAFQNVTGLSGYQGIFTPYVPEYGRGTRKLRLHRVNLGYDPSIPKTSGAGKPLKLLYFGSADNSNDRVPYKGTRLNKVFVDGSYWNWDYYKAVYAQPVPGSGGCATFDAKHNTRGRVCNGPPKSGDFAKPNKVGQNYDRSWFCK